jgi:hypothetical protein
MDFFTLRRGWFGLVDFSGSSGRTVGVKVSRLQWGSRGIGFLFFLGLLAAL